MSKFRGFCFTWNNYTSQSKDELLKLNPTYIVFGHEIAPSTGTPHLQGYLYFENPRSIKAIQKAIKGWHVERCKADIDANYTYATKDLTDVFEQGIKPKTHFDKGTGEKQRWSDALSAAREGRFNDIPPNMYIQYYSTFKRIRIEEGSQQIHTTITVLRPWQEQLRDELLGPADDRRIIWYHDTVGRNGKTQFAKYMALHHQATLLTNGSTKDLAYLLPDNPKIIIFNFTRSMEERSNYSIIEACKDGFVVSTKYQPRTIYFKEPHIVVFSNFAPNRGAMSEDRWEIRTFN